VKLGVKLISSYLFVVGLVAVVGIISGSYNRKVTETLKVENQVATQTVEYAFNVERNLYVTLRLLQELNDSYLSSNPGELELERRGDGFIRADIKEQFDEMYTNFINLRNIKVNSVRTDSTDIAFFDDLKDKLIAYEGYANLIQNDLAEGNLKSAGQVFNITLVPYFDNNILPSLQTLRELARQEQAIMVQQLDESRTKMENVTIWATLIAFIIALSIVLIINASIVKPMSKITEASKKIGDGDLDTHIDLDRKDEVGQLASSFNNMVENLKKKTISRDFLDNVIESMKEALFIVNEKDEIERVNHAACKLLDYKLDELIGKHVDDILLSEPGSRKSVETKLRKSSGQQVDVSVTSSVLSNPYGSSELRLFVVSDISERVASEEQIKKSLEEKKVLLAEIHHRVKNNLAVISGLLQMQSWNIQSDEAKRVLADSQLRVESIALVHEMLYESDSLAYIRYDKYINDLMQAISSMYMDTGMDVDLVSEVDGVDLTINQAIPVSLLLNEIIVNAYKHAFPEGKKGRIEVKMWEELSRVYIEVSDDGIGVDAEKMQEKSSLGLTLIRTLIKQVDGEFKFEKIPSGGTKVSVSFEMDF
jgi:two-component sensor histidine kinase/HAMP domain-containing protein